jgi:hypothetical protein
MLAAECRQYIGLTAALSVSVIRDSMHYLTIFFSFDDKEMPEPKIV